MARKRLIAGIFTALLAPSVALATTCPGGVDKAEIGTRYLLTEFMVAALACHSDPGFRDSYGTFVRRYNSGLVRNARSMKSQFGSGAALDSYVTRLANHAALRQNEGTFCSHARLRITRALAAAKTATLGDVIDELGYTLGGPACGDMTPIAALGGKREAAPAKNAQPVSQGSQATGRNPTEAGLSPMPAPGGETIMSPRP